MKFPLALWAALTPPAVESSRVRARTEENTMVEHFHRLFNSSSSRLRSHDEDPNPRYRYGSSECACIGIDYLDGNISVEYKGQTFTYPRDVGGRCHEWEQDAQPDCQGDSPPDWCQRAWCYVDPCDCDLEVPPKQSKYMEDAKYQGYPLYFSYSTCASTDTWSTEDAKKQVKDIESMCAKKPDPNVYGKENCNCIGIEGLAGNSLLSVDDALYKYPADVGTSCEAWDDDRHPLCRGEAKQEWCSQRWCWVDPCTCVTKVPPSESKYADEGMWKGRPMYYSYTTCGSPDLFDHTGEHSCTQFKDKRSCEDDEDRWCSWEKDRGICLGKELTVVCEEGGGGDILNRGEASAARLGFLAACASTIGAVFAALC